MSILVLKEEAKAQNRAIVEAQEENNYEMVSLVNTGSLNVDLTKMMTKVRYSENIYIWFRLEKGCIAIHHRGGDALNTKVPLDDNLILYSSGSTIATNAYYIAGKNGIPVYKGINSDTRDFD